VQACLGCCLGNVARTMCRQRPHNTHQTAATEQFQICNMIVDIFEPVKNLQSSLLCFIVISWTWNDMPAVVRR
jgi:hypothetical protein